jgi:hypothetical protein
MSLNIHRTQGGRSERQLVLTRGGLQIYVQNGLSRCRHTSFESVKKKRQKPKTVVAKREKSPFIRVYHLHSHFESKTHLHFSLVNGV